MPWSGCQGRQLLAKQRRSLQLSVTDAACLALDSRGSTALEFLKEGGKSSHIRRILSTT